MHPQPKARRPRQPEAPPAIGRRERRRVEIRERLFKAATGLFSTRGVQATTVKDITEAADVGKGTFFNYFPTKEHVLAMFYERQLEGFEAALQAAREEREPVQDILNKLFRETAEPASRSPALVRSFLRAIVSNEAVRAMVLPTLMATRQRIEGLFEIGQQRGVVRRDQSAGELARLSMEAAFGTALFWSLHPAVPLHDLLAQNRRMIWSHQTAGAAGKKPVPSTGPRARETR